VVKDVKYSYYVKKKTCLGVLDKRRHVAMALKQV